LRSPVACGILAAVQDPVTQLTNDLIASYARVGGINHLHGKNLPSKRVVTALTKDLLRLLFPGFFDEKLIHSSEIKVETAVRLDAILGPLEDEIRKSLEYNPPPDTRRANCARRRTASRWTSSAACRASASCCKPTWRPPSTATPPR
jgi:hypothetical protein